jgi:hypothetical protein
MKALFYGKSRCSAISSGRTRIDRKGSGFGRKLVCFQSSQTAPDPKNAINVTRCSTTTKAGVLPGNLYSLDPPFGAVDNTARYFCKPAPTGWPRQMPEIFALTN